jgi:hypothetical protein
MKGNTLFQKSPQSVVLRKLLQFLVAMQVEVNNMLDRCYIRGGNESMLYELGVALTILSAEDEEEGWKQLL